jgi:transcriptional regulator with XRE-family HTH domain
MDAIGVRLKQERDRLGLSQDEVCTAAGINRRSQSNYENSVRSPDAAYLASISKLGIDVGYVITGRRSKPSKAELWDFLKTYLGVAKLFKSKSREDNFETAYELYIDINEKITQTPTPEKKGKRAVNE